MNRKKIPFFWIGLFGLLAAGGAWGIYAKLTEVVDVRSARAEETALEEYVEDRAHTSLPQVIHITMPQQGRVLPISLREGDRVKKGEILARLEDVDLQDALKEAEAIVKAMANTVLSSQAQVKASKARRDYLKWLAEAREDLYSKKAVSEQLFREAKTDYLESAMDAEGNQALSYAYAAIDSTSKLLPIFINRSLKRTVIESPREGTVLRRYVWNTKVLPAGEPLLDLGNLEELEITAPILTEEAVRIAPRDPVRIFGETVGAEPLKGRVLRIKPQGYTKLSSLGVEQQRVDVIIGFDEGELENLREKYHRTLGLEYRVRVRITTASREKTLTIPRTALFRGPRESWRVFVIREGKAEEIEVVPGMQNQERVEILKGLLPGDPVIVAPEDTIKSGLRVRGTSEAL
ncbi:MAG TPA: biotin/lipoyl-binding protein [Synergistaceae bacterium]|nr:biotin/lipoyl-binding protein [Synergistaceae bacterium]HPJ25580.1 biotin/lipoyl-binding protein [Synergistaceae bacterium]HPQ37793.1 biotin/lipoyl-binding protein [Synergistaceae bacterium]